MNKKVKIAGALLLIVCFILVLVSRTIYIYRLPVVTAAMPFSGTLSKTERAVGLADWAEKSDIYADTGGKVEAVFVKEGQWVEKGEPLFSLSFDEDDMQQRLKEIEVSREQKNREVGSSRLQMEANNREVEKAEKETEDLRVLYEAGAIPRNEYDNAQNNVQILKDQNKILLNQISQLELDLKAYDIQQSAYEKELEKFSQSTYVYASEGGEIIELSVSEGQQIPDGFHAGKIGWGDSYEVTCTVSLENNFVIAGDACKLKNTSHSFEGIVKKITLTEEGKNVAVSVLSSEISVGETFDVTFEKAGAETHTLVPNGALNMDNDGYFLYQVKQREGILGEEYYVQKLRVYIGDNDDENTVITKGLSFYEPIVLSSSKSIAEGQSTRLSNVGDFFE